MTPFIDCTGVAPPNGRYLVSASTGDGLKDGNDWRAPEAADVFTLTAPPAEHFAGRWARTDRPVAEGVASRTWVWGPQPLSEVLTEPYDESPEGVRAVQYFDKSRMELSQPGADPNSSWYVTNGLLAMELMTGRLQLGDATFEQREPAGIPVAGDPDDTLGPTYATFGTLLDDQAATPGEPLVVRVDRAGSVTEDEGLARYAVAAGARDELTGHAVAEPFWSFMTSSGLVYDSGDYVEAPLFLDPVFATGRPVTDAYWASVLVDGASRDALIQCFERRCLTYTPENPAGWQVEAGNIGLHYYTWRYARQP